MSSRRLWTNNSIVRPLNREKHGETNRKLLVVKVQGTDAIYAYLHIQGLPLGVRGLQLVVVVRDADFSIAKVLRGQFGIKNRI